MIQGALYARYSSDNQRDAWLAGQMHHSGVDLRSRDLRSQMTGFDSSP
jgi:hypothetical protein